MLKTKQVIIVRTRKRGGGKREGELREMLRFL